MTIWKREAPAEFKNTVKLENRLTRLTPETLLEWNYITCASPVVSHNQTGAAAVSADGARAGLIFPGPNGELYICDSSRIGAFTAAGESPQIEGTVPAADTASTVAGLNIQLDHNNTDNAGMEMTLGPPHGSNYSSFTVGTHSGYIDATFFTAAWDDYDTVAIGFRKTEAYQTGHGAILGTGAAGDGVYTDFAALGALGTVDDNVETATDLNNSGTSVSTDTTDDATDSQNMRLRVTLSSTGAVTYSLIHNAVAGAGTLADATASVAFTFDDGDTVIPYLITHGDGSEDVPLFLKDIKVVRTPGVSYQN